MNLNLKGKTAIVCGSSQGLGLESAKEIAMLGANVILFARNEEKLKKALTLLDTSRGQKHDYLVADFNHPDQVKSVIEKFLERKTSVEILINNSGGPKGGALMDADESEFIEAINRHLICSHILVKALVPFMKEAGYGRIINIISVSVKQPIAGLAVSNTTRGAMASWSKTLASEVGPFGITVNNVLPGYTRTARYDELMISSSQKTGKTIEELEQAMVNSIPLRRVGDPADFGAVVAFLCSPSAGYISGVNIPVDGGRLLCL
ncbi:MAG: SDR family oxidoreductase [Chitinophagaceae bacterium]|nr:SDR family oxidoreductase [Chitinophagaceae bacterium]